MSSYGITKITRITTNSISNKFLVAAEIGGTIETKDPETNSTTETAEVSDVEAIVQRNLDAYNARDIDAFMKDYADDVKLYAYPNTLQTEGKEAMRKGYKDWFDRVPDLRAFIKKTYCYWQQSDR